MRLTLACLGLLVAGCTEPTWYPGLPAGVDADGGATDGGGTDGGGTDGGADGGADGGTDELPCSSAGAQPANLVIDLQADLGLILWWRDQACEEWSYGAVPPYVPREQGTYVGHAWVLRDAVGAYHDHLVVTETEQRWEITE